jgi:hypothetical protein
VDCKRLSQKIEILFGVDTYDINATTMTVIIKKDEMERLVTMEKFFHKKTDEDIFYLHNEANQYACMSVNEFMEQLAEFETDSGEKIELYDCNIRTCKISGRKYKRVILTSEHLVTLSKTEFTFGHMISGWSYVFRPDKWNAIKADVISRVDYKTTEYGKSTRRDLSGKMYKVEKH